MRAKHLSNLAALFLACAAGSSCSWTLDLDGYSSRTESGAISALTGVGESADAGVDAAPQPVGEPLAEAVRDYRFPRGGASFSVGVAEGLAVNAAGESLALMPATLPTERGGSVDVAADGSFTFTPTGSPGTFWGTDWLEYRTSERVLQLRLTVYPDRIRLLELAGSGAGFGVSAPRQFDHMGLFFSSLAPAGDANGDGLEDFVLGLPGPPTRDLQMSQGGGAYVLFGTRAVENIVLEERRDGAGFLVVGDGDPNTIDSFGMAVAGAGDVNGDGLDDVLINSWSVGVSGQLSRR